MNNKKYNQQGQLLMEALLAIAVIGILAGFVTTLVNISVKTNQISGKQSVALALAQEAVIAVRTIKETNDTVSRGWNKIYELVDTVDYHPDNSGLAWALVSGSEEVVVEGVSYNRKINFDNTIERDGVNGGGNINASGTADPSTIKAVITVTAEGISGIILEEYITRAKNETKIWNSSDADDASVGDGFKSTGAVCADTAVIGAGVDANVELNSGSSC